MAEENRVSPVASDLPGAPSEIRRAGRLPGAVRYLVAALFGGLVAALASYLLRSIGY